MCIRDSQVEAPARGDRHHQRHHEQRGQRVVEDIGPPFGKATVDQGTQAGTGLQLTAVDLRHTGRLDIIAPGKSGLYVFFNEGRIRNPVTTSR